MNDMEPRIPVDLARQPDFALGGATVRPSSREIALDGASETVEPRVMQVLVVLAGRRGDVVSRDELIRQCWEGRIVGEDAITRCLAKVRRLTERMQAVTIETIPRVGYRLVEGAATPRAATAGSRRRVGTLAIGLGLLLLGVVGLAAVTWNKPGDAPTFAVLPFTSLNSGEDMHLFGKSVGAATAAALSGAGLPLASTAPLPATVENNPADVGRALGADYVVSGSVRQDAGVVRAIARVDEVEGRITVYSRVFETPAGERHRLPDMVAAGMTDAIASGVPGAALGSDPAGWSPPPPAPGATPDARPETVQEAARPGLAPPG